MAIAIFAKEFNGFENQRMAGAAVGESAVPVIRAAVTIEGNSDFDIVFVKEVKISRTQL